MQLNYWFACCILAVFCGAQQISPTKFGNDGKEGTKAVGERRAGHSDNSLNLGSLISMSRQLPPCMYPCIADLPSVFPNDLLSSSQHQHDLDSICEAYDGASDCVIMHCPSIYDNLFDLFITGVHYMCIEQRDAFERALPCLQNANEVATECEEHCGLVSQVKEVSQSVSNLTTTTKNSLILLKKVGSLCSPFQCTLSCVRSKINERCRDVGNLVIEPSLRTLEKTAQALDSLNKTISDVIRAFLPDECDFFLDQSTLDAFRMNVDFERIGQFGSTDQQQQIHSSQNKEWERSFEDPERSSAGRSIFSFSVLLILIAFKFFL